MTMTKGCTRDSTKWTNYKSTFSTDFCFLVVTERHVVKKSWQIVH